MGGEMIPIIAVVSVFSYLSWKRYLDYQARMEALRRGIDPKSMATEPDNPAEPGKPVAPTPVRPPRDHRLSSMIWIAVGLAYMVAGFFSVGMTKGVERGIAVGVWGLIPLAVGIGRYAYHKSTREGEPDCYLRSAFTLMAVGVSYVLCVTLSTGMMKGAERAMAVGVWGLIPFAIGVVMYIYGGMVRRERADEDQGSHGARGM